MCQQTRCSNRFHCVSVCSTSVLLAKPIKEKLYEMHKNVAVLHSLADCWHAAMASDADVLGPVSEIRQGLMKGTSS